MNVVEMIAQIIDKCEDDHYKELHPPEEIAQEILNLTYPCEICNRNGKTDCNGTGKREKMLAIRAKDQTLPEIPEFFDDWGGESGKIGYEQAQQDMLNAGWMKGEK